MFAALLEAGGAAAVGAVRRLMASNAHFSTGVKRWVSLRNIRATGKFSGFMRASQMTMLVAALRAAPLDLGDDGSLQHRLIEGGEIQMQLTAILEKELWAVGDRGRLVVLQAEGTAAFEGTLGPFGHGCQKHPNAHLQYHVPEIAVPGPTGRGAPVHWETGRNIESIQGGMHGDYDHITGVNSDEQMIARRCDEREFVAQTLGPALDRVAAAAVAAAAGGGGAAGGSASDAGSAGSGSSEGDAAPFPPPAAAAAGRPSPYTRYPRAPPVLARLTGALWPGMLAADARCDSRLSGRMLEAFAAAYERAAAAVAGLPPLDPARCLWRRALLLSRPASLESEGCRRRLAVVPDGAAGVSHRDARRYAGQQPCVQMLVAGAGGAPPVPDVHEMRKIEALVSIDVRPQAGGARRPAALTPRTTGGNATIDFALVRVLRPQADRDSRCFLSFVNEGPSLTAGPPLLASERDLFRLVRVTSLAQPRWAFPDFGDGHPPPGERDVLPWDGRFVSVFVMPGA